MNDSILQLKKKNEENCVFEQNNSISIEMPINHIYVPYATIAD